MSQLLTRVGPLQGADGASPVARSDREGALVVAQARGKYAEAVRRGNVYTATMATQCTPGTALGTTAALVLYNPIGSGKNLVVLRASAAYASGTLGAGAMLWCLGQLPTQNVPSGGTVSAPVACLVGNQATGVGLVRFNATVTQPTAVRPMFSAGPELATSVEPLYAITEDTDGEFVVGPGCSVQLQFIGGGGTAPLLWLGITWEETTAA